MGGNDYWAIADLYLRGESIAINNEKEITT